MKLTYIAQFDAFKTDEVQNLTEPMGDIKEFFQLFYLAEYKVSIFAALIAGLLVGISFMVKNNDTTERKVNKAWLIRLAAVILLIFSIGNFINLVWGTKI